jgi:hypothetical protein
MGNKRDQRFRLCYFQVIKNQMIILFLVPILSCWIINGDLTLATLSLLTRTIIILSYIILSIAAEKPQGSTALVSIEFGQLLDTCPVPPYRKDLEINSNCKEARLFSFSSNSGWSSLLPTGFAISYGFHGSNSQKPIRTIGSQSAIVASKKVAIQHFEGSP